MQVNIEQNAQNVRSQWVLNAPEPPSLWRVLANSLRKTISHYKCTLCLSVMQVVFAILAWGRNCTATKFRKDLLAILTIASLCIPKEHISHVILTKL